jgi:GT2 family glycosyltransferase
MKLFVALLCYRVPELTIDCLHSLGRELDRRAGAKVGVLENGTGGDAADRLREVIAQNQWESWAELTVVYPNRGFCVGNNLLIRAALESADPPEYVFLLNADTIVQEKALDALVQFMDLHPRAGIAGSQLLSPDWKVQSSPFRFVGILSELDRGLKLGIVSSLLAPWAVVPPTPSSACAVDWVSGASMILRKTMLEEIGLLDEGLYTYFDDIDLCFRARRAGWETWYVPESRIVHLGGASTGVASRLASRRPAYWFQARQRFLLKNYGGMYTAFVDAAFLVGLAICRLRRWILRRPDTDPPKLLGDFLSHSVFCTGFRLTEVENPALK